jgi:hypothetical protein
MYKWQKWLLKKLGYQLEKKKKTTLTLKERCETCVWWKAEEENNKVILVNPDLRYCDLQCTYTNKNLWCNNYKEERFEATKDSIQTEEFEIKHDLSIEESESNDARREKK